MVAPVAAKTQADAQAEEQAEEQAEPVAETVEPEPDADVPRVSHHRKNMKFATDGYGGAAHHSLHTPSAAGFVPPIPEPVEEIMPVEPLQPEPPAVEFIPPLPEPEPLEDMIPAEPAPPEPAPPEPIPDEPVVEDAPVEEPPMEEPVAEEVDDGWGMPAPPVIEPPEEEPIPEESPEAVGGLMPPALAPPVFAPPAPAPVDESSSVFSESDFNPVVPSFDEKELATWGSGLPDVAAMPEMGVAHLDAPHLDSDQLDAEPADEIASNLDVPPLNLAVPALPMPGAAPEIDESDEDDIENLLSSMMAPVTT
jgi:hypothetical protein